LTEEAASQMTASKASSSGNQNLHMFLPNTP
jgi:hypothetical protein